MKTQPENHACGRDTGLASKRQEDLGAQSHQCPKLSVVWWGQGKINLMFKRSLAFQCLNLMHLVVLQWQLFHLKTDEKTPLSAHIESRRIRSVHRL